MKSRIRTVAIHLRQQVHQVARLRPVVRRIAVNFEERSQAVDQVVEGRREIGVAIKMSPGSGRETKR